MKKPLSKAIFAALALVSMQVYANPDRVVDNQAAPNKLTTGKAAGSKVVANNAVASKQTADKSTANKAAIDPTTAIEQFYINKNTLNQEVLQTLGNPTNFARSYCNGVWVSPQKKLTSHTNDEKITTTSKSDKETILAYADTVYVKPNEYGDLLGNVLIEQSGKQINAEQVHVDLKTNTVTTHGQATISNGDIFSITDQIQYDIDSKAPSVTSSAFFSQSKQAHGAANKITQTQEGVVQLENVTYTTCPPNKQSWHIEAKDLELDDNTGRGIAHDAKLKLLGYPALYLPYINFPIDDRRMSGFLVPQFGFSNDGGLDFSLPYYLNLAENYDATVTPRLILERGGMLEGEIRYLTDGLGQSTLSGGYLANDEKHNGDRAFAKFEHHWQASRRLSINAQYNYVSDKDFFTDLGDDPSIQDELNLPRNLIATYTDDKRELTGSLKAETFQTVDKNLPDSLKPYSRMPQLNLSYAQGNPLGLSHSSNVDVGYFTKRITDNSEPEKSGTRLYGDYQLDYQLARSWGFLKPAVKLASITTIYDEKSITNQGLIEGENEQSHVFVPNISLDSGLIFEKNTYFDESMLSHTIEPRIFYSYAPRKDQSNLPNFDTTNASPSFDQLFTHQRFLGHDRLADSNSLSIGASYKLYDDTGLERLNIGLANAQHFNDKRINLSGKAVPIAQSSGTFGRVQGYLLPELKLTADAAVDDSGNHNFSAIQLSWQPKSKSLVNIGYFDRAAVASSNQSRYQTASASLITPLTKQWQLVAHSQYDFLTQKPIDLLVGANYESCCYRFAMYGRSYFNNLDNPKVDNRRNQVMAELTLKGLAGLSGNLKSLLNKKVLGLGNQLD